MKAVIIAIVAVIIIGGGVFAAVALNKPAATPASQSQTNKPVSSDKTATGTTFTITANDTSATPDTLNVKQGDTITITFNVSSQGTYHGGLKFKSSDPAIDSGSIAEGDSKTVTFTATKSFEFTPFWYQSSVQKDYFVTVNVQ
jgi:plastocyanin